MLPAVNTLFNALLQHPQFKTVDFSKLCVSQAGGMAASEGTAMRWQQATGCAMVEGWGMSETCRHRHQQSGHDQDLQRHASACRCPASTSRSRTTKATRCRRATSGELCIRGPNVMIGYYNQPAETASAFTADGFMRTGDIAVMDARGYTQIVDRKKDMIIVSGFNVFPNELENVISLCPGVVECAAVGMPDEQQGEAIKVFVVRADKTLTEDPGARLLPRAADRLQAAPAHRVSRGAAEDERRQDPAARAAAHRLSARLADRPPPVASASRQRWSLSIK